MRKIIVLLLFLISVKGHTQLTNSMFSKDPIINLENFQKQRLYFGFYLGLNSFDFKIDYKTNQPEDIYVKKTTRFNIGLVADLKIQEYISLRFEPGYYSSKRDLTYPSVPKITLSGDYLHFPLLMKFSSLRTGNVRPYLLGGVSTTLNLSPSDKQNSTFKLKKWTQNYEMGFGIDLFSEYFIFSPSIRGVFGINDELIHVTGGNTDNIQSLKNRAIFINFTFH